MDEFQNYLINLQLFAAEDSGEKTEQATPRRREEARKKGQVFKSSDLNSAVILLAGCSAVFISFPYMLNQLQGFTSLYLTNRALEDFNNEYAYYLLLEVLLLLAKMLLPVILATLLQLY
jgi:flagellar biosynthetic protein FlhB